LGYVTRYRENQLAWHSGGFRPRPELYKNWPKTKQYKAWVEGCRNDWQSPNSTDVHSIRLIYNVPAYLKKYMVKEGQNSNIAGRLWGCSQRLSVIQGGRAAEYSAISDDLGKLEANKLVKTFKTDYYVTIMVTPADLLKLGCLEILSVFNQFIAEKFPEYRPPTLFP
jgi:hypothetical protein